MTAEPPAGAYPAFPPGFWRRIEVHPSDGAVTGGLEDDVHRFELRMTHSARVVAAVEAEAVRFPWSPCPGAAPHLIESLRGRPLPEIARLDIRQECTHLFDLAVLCAAYVDHKAPLRFDMRVADRIADRAVATLDANGERTLSWLLDGTRIADDGPLGGRDLRAFSQWRGDLEAEAARQAGMLRRAVFVSGARRQPERMADLAADPAAHRLGACYRYQPPYALNAVQSPAWRTDFSQAAAGPLQGFDPIRAHIGASPEHPEITINRV